MTIVTRHFLMCLLLIGYCLSADFPEQRRSEKEPFPRPKDGALLEINPPAFVWLPVEDAAYYAVHISGDGGEWTHTVHDENLLALPDTLPAGRYTWTVQAFDSEGTPLAERRPYSFSIPQDATPFPFPNIDELLGRIPQHHPRLIFDRNSLDTFRASLSNSRANGWLAVKRMADESLELGRIKKPWYVEIEDYNTRRLEYRRYYHHLRPFIDEGLQSLSLAWLMTGEQKYADKAKEILFSVIDWPADGATSCNRIGFDEPGLSFSRCLHRVYDWLYDTLSEEERAIVREAVIARARDTWQRVGVNRPFHQNPGSSHDGRLIGYLGEQALVLAGEAPDDEVKKWLDYSLTSFWTVFPHWGGSDGGWAEGVGYAAAYNMRATTWIESFYTVGLDLWRKPFFQKIKDYFFYCARPNDEFWAFGDGAERGPRSVPSRALILRSLMAHYGQRLHDPACQWWADQVPLDKGDISSPVIALILGEDLPGEPPVAGPNAALFRDVGWAAMHSNPADLDNDVFFLLKSSPYGSVSHSHADQNAFYLSVGGRALAIPSGYYGPVYGMPHHAEWTRQSKANNTILVNGQGQKARDYTAVGAIIDFADTGRMTYLCGNAAPAYKGALKKFDRHVLFIRPGFFVILDDLEAPTPSTYQWMLHSLEQMNVDEENDRVVLQRGPAQARFQLFSSSGDPFALSQTDQFDTPYEAGVESGSVDPVANHWHLTASSRTPQKSLRIAAFLSAANGDAPTPVITQFDGWIKAVVKDEAGESHIWTKMSPGASLPDELQRFRARISEHTLVIGIWKGEDGKVEFIANGEH